MLIKIVDLASNPESASSLSSIRYVTEGKLATNEKEDAIAYLREYNDLHIDIVMKITNDLNHHSRSEV